MKLDTASDSTSNMEKFCSNRRYYKEEVTDQLCQMLSRAQRDKV